MGENKGCKAKALPQVWLCFATLISSSHNKRKPKNIRIKREKEGHYSIMKGHSRKGMVICRGDQGYC